MTRITVQYLRQRGACCSEPGNRYSDEALAPLGPPEGLTPLEVCDLSVIPAEDRLWVILHEDWIHAAELRLLACWWARGALALGGTPEPRSVAAVETAERFAIGRATPEELDAAWAAARDAARDAAWDAAWAAARDAAWAAAWEAAWAAAWDAARDAARAAARDAARAAARAAARDAARDAAWDAARDAQRADVRRVLTGEWTSENYQEWRP